MSWIVKNTLRATLSFRGLDLAIKAGESHDLDVVPGRGKAEASDQIVVAFEEGYLENVHKEAPAAPGGKLASPAAVAALVQPGVSKEEFAQGLESFRAQLLDELRARLSEEQQSQSGSTDLEAVRAAISQDMQELVGELKLVRERFASVKGRIKEDSSLSQAEVKARLAFLEEQERELLKNFETVGRQVESDDDGDVMDMADLLSNL
ncbi:MAG TPA: hypothetical protein DEA08_25665 [Planctomycetes bacterium]|nr:hypothetical protein [Planctomycetota bacterium]